MAAMLHAHDVWMLNPCPVQLPAETAEVLERVRSSELMLTWTFTSSTA